MFSQTSDYTVEQLLGIVATNIVCTVHPYCVAEHATFILDVDIITFSDVKCDDLGLWKTKSYYFKLSAAGIHVADVQPNTKSSRMSYHVLVRHYYVHSTYPLYHKIIVNITSEIAKVIMIV